MRTFVLRAIAVAVVLIETVNTGCPPLGFASAAGSQFCLCED